MSRQGTKMGVQKSTPRKCQEKEKNQREGKIESGKDGGSWNVEEEKKEKKETWKEEVEEKGGKRFVGKLAKEKGDKKSLKEKMFGKVVEGLEKQREKKREVLY